MNPNHYPRRGDRLPVRGTAPDWPAGAAIGKTLVSSSMIDRVAAEVGRPLVEVPVGFKWFVPGLLDGSLGFGGEESAGASFLRRDGSVWTTDKDGIILALLASEITAVTGQDAVASTTRELTERYGDPAYARVDAPADREQKARLGQAVPDDRSPPTELAGEPITAVLTEAPGNGAAIGGTQGDHRVGLVRRPPVGHRGRLQDLRRVVPRRRPPGAGAGRGEVGGRRGAGLGLTQSKGQLRSGIVSPRPISWARLFQSIVRAAIQ